MESDKRVLACVCDGLFTLPVEEKAIGGNLPWRSGAALINLKVVFMNWACVCDGLFPLPVEEKVASWTWSALAMAFSPCLSRKRFGARLRWPFPPTCRGKGRLMDLVRVCNDLFPLPVEEKAVSWTWCAFAVAFSPCLSRKRLFQGSPESPGSPRWEYSRWPFPPACQGKGYFRAPPEGLQAPQDNAAHAEKNTFP